MVDLIPGLSHDLHIAIAKVAIDVSLLEVWLEKLIDFSLAKQPHTAKVMLGSVAAEKMVKLAEAILMDKFPSDSAKITKVFQEITEIRQLRNEIIHWSWEPADEEGVSRNMKIRPQREPEFTLKTAEYVDTVASRAHRASQSLVRWYTEFAFE